MPMIKNAVSPEKTYQVVSVEKTDPPVGIDSGNWYRYVIALEDRQIVGNMRGTQKQVTAYARECAKNLSSRVGRGTSAWAKKK